MFDAKRGKLKWKFETGSHVKSSLTFDESKNLIIFGSLDKKIYALDIMTGELKGQFETTEGIYSTPLVYKDHVYVASLDKHLYCFNLTTGQFAWDFTTSGRIFASPEVIDNSIFIGSNDGRLYELDAKTGQLISAFQAVERITNKIVFNQKTRRIFLTTFANEVLCLEHSSFTK